MKFLFADNQDFVDPGYDFLNETYSPHRMVQRDDQYPHEFFETPPYDGLLVSRAIVGDERWSGKYTTAQSMRFRRAGAKAFLRYNPPKCTGMVMGDCGAFSYVREEHPPYCVEEMVDYYLQCGFTHAVSIDHVILSYEESLDLRPDAVPDEWQRRYDITLKLAEEFLTYCSKNSVAFQPIGVAQGWSPASYAEAARRLVAMGYDYIAIGGLVPLKIPQIHRVLTAVREVTPNVRIHLFGFTKADNISEFVKYKLESFDSTSPVIRAFKDHTRNYLSSDSWYTAIRIPHADENLKFKREILAGMKEQRTLRDLEDKSLQALRGYDKGLVDVGTALDAVTHYGREFSPNLRLEAYRRTLEDQPWKRCSCRACREAGVEVIIFRGNNRNRRRGFHNLYEFYRRLTALRDAPLQDSREDSKTCALTLYK